MSIVCFEFEITHRTSIYQKINVNQKVNLIKKYQTWPGQKSKSFDAKIRIFLSSLFILYMSLKLKGQKDERFDFALQYSTLYL